MFRLIIDLPLGEDEELAADLSKEFLSSLEEMVLDCFVRDEPFDNLQYRLAKDEDRHPKNYLNKNENGHCATSKSKLFTGAIESGDDLSAI
jgi:hypothetical protein